MNVKLVVATMLCLFCAETVAHAQDSMGAQQGLQPYQSYEGGNIDHINMANGNLYVHIPLVDYPQRGSLKLSFGLDSNNKSWITYYNPNDHNTYWEPGASTPGFGNLASFQVVEDQKLIVYFPGNCRNGWSQLFVNSVNGSSHPADFTAGTLPGDCSQKPTPVSFETFDGTGTRVDISAPGQSSPVATDRSGTLYNRWGINTGTYREDANGNLILYHDTTVNNQDSSNYIDSLGRQIPLFPIIGFTNYQVPTTTDYTGCTGSLRFTYALVWSVPGLNGGSSTYKMCYVNVYLQTAFNVQGIIEYSGNMTFLQSVVLPNGTAWTFAYDSYGDLQTVTFPTGGTLSYSYVNLPNSCMFDGSSTTERTVSARFLNANDGTGAHEWQYNWGNTANTTTNIATDPLNNDTVYTNTCFLQDTWRTTKQQVYQGLHTNGTLLKTINTDWEVLNPHDSGLTVKRSALPIRDTTIWGNGETKKTETDYDSSITWETGYSGSYGDVVARRDYDYGSGSAGTLLRTTTNNYLAFGSSKYLTNNMLDRLSQVAIFAGGSSSGACGANGAIACTSFGYDESSVVSSGITTQHGASPYGTYRGNQTSVNRWLNTTGGYLKTSRVYYDTGMVSTIADPNKNTTTYSYSSSYAGAYVTQTQLPTTGSFQHITSANYDSNTGLRTSYTDENSKITTYGYDDMWRIQNITYPASDSTGTGGGSETYTYDDTPGQLNVQVQHTINSSQSTNEYILFDGLGRQISQIKANGESTPYDRVDTCYDGLGRKNHVSYPYQSSSTSPASCTNPPSGDGYTYDALNRITQVTHSDTSTILTSYGSPGGRATDVSDEGTGNPNTRVERVSQVDGLGRLVSVCEVTTSDQLGNGGQHLSSCGQDIAKPGFLTTYSYDVLGNVLSVTQGTIAQRSFTYDSLSRLITATNPESGATCYGTYSGSTCQSGYDADGNLIYRTRPAPNQTNSSTTVTTTYQYDALNRLTQTSYSDGVTPATLFVYDTGDITMGTQDFNTSNVVGRLSVSTVLSQPWGNEPMKAYSYDPMGRISQFWQHTPAFGNNGPNTAVTYAYDYIGDETAFSFGTSPVTPGQFTYTYNIAGRMLTFNNPASTMNVMNVPGTNGYDAYGHFVSASFGNGLSQSWAYDGRGRLQSLAVGTNCSNGTCGSPVYSLSLGYFNDSNVNTANDSVNGNWTYAYDDFNRASTGVATNGEGCSWAYDRYGNRWQQNPDGGSCPSPQYSFTGNNNRIDNGSYDAAGNLLYDFVHYYTYDPENRIISVDSGATTYTYDADGKRVEKNVGGALVDYVYDTNGRVLWDTVGTVIEHLEYYAPGLHVATALTNSQDNGANPYFHHSDWLGTERLRTDINGVSCETISSLPFGDGQTIGGTCGDVDAHHFTGKERDTESNLDYFGARYYSSTQGRFMIPDWAAKPTAVPYAEFGGPQSLNLYAYVRNNPLSKADPDGHDRDPAWWRESNETCGFWCGLGQRLGNLFHGSGFHTDQQVEDILHRDANWLRSGGIKTEGMSESQIIHTYDAIQSATRSGRGSVTVDNTLFILGMIGAAGTQVRSKTLWEQDGAHIDIENPAPGKRPGQIHYQDAANNKFQYNFETGQFDGLSNTQNRNLLENPDVQSAIQRGQQYLGIGGPDVLE